MRVNPGTGRIYQLSPTSRMGSTPLPRHTAPLARPAQPAAVQPKKAGFLDGLKGLFAKATSAVGNFVSGIFGMFTMSSTRELHAGGRTTSSGGGGTGTV